MHWSVVVSTFLLLSACTNVGPSVVVLKHPSTGDIVQCRGAIGYAIPAARDAARCADAYIRQGYIRI